MPKLSDIGPGKKIKKDDSKYESKTARKSKEEDKEARKAKKASNQAQSDSDEEYEVDFIEGHKDSKDGERM